MSFANILQFLLFERYLCPTVHQNLQLKKERKKKRVFYNVYFDWQTWVFIGILMYICGVLPVKYGFFFFLIIIINLRYYLVIIFFEVE